MGRDKIKYILRTIFMVDVTEWGCELRMKADGSANFDFFSVTVIPFYESHKFGMQLVSFKGSDVQVRGHFKGERMFIENVEVTGWVDLNRLVESRRQMIRLDALGVLHSLKD
jgi:hypothetical protein